MVDYLKVGQQFFDNKYLSTDILISEENISGAAHAGMTRILSPL